MNNNLSFKIWFLANGKSGAVHSQPLFCLRNRGRERGENFNFEYGHFISDRHVSHTKAKLGKLKMRLGPELMLSIARR